VWRVNNYATAVRAESGVGITSPFASVLFRKVKVAQGHGFACREMVEVYVLVAISVRVGVVEDPFVAGGEVGAVAVSGHNALADDLCFAGFVLVEIERISIRGVPCPGEDVVWVSPDEVGGFAVRVYHADVFAVGGGCEHSGTEAAYGLVGRVACGAPSVQKDESRAVCVEEEMVEVVLCVLRIAGDLAEFGNVCQ